MSDFRKAIQAGISGAEVALAAQGEIATIINELARDLLQATEGDVAFAVLEDSITSALAAAAATFTNSARSEARTLRLLVKPTQGPADKGFEIGRLSTSSTGYPVVISGAEVTISATSGSALRKALIDLLSRPETGKAILAAREKARAKAPSSKDQLTSKPSSKAP